MIFWILSNGEMEFIIILRVSELVRYAVKMNVLPGHHLSGKGERYVVRGSMAQVC